MADAMNVHQMLRWTALALLLAATFALGATPAAARNKHYWNYDYQYENDDEGEDDDGDGYYRSYEPPRVIYRERRYYYEPAPTYYYPPPPPPVYYYPRPDYEPSFSFGVTLPIR